MTRLNYNELATAIELVVTTALHALQLKYQQPIMTDITKYTDTKKEAEEWSSKHKPSKRPSNISIASASGESWPDLLDSFLLALAEKTNIKFDGQTVTGDGKCLYHACALYLGINAPEILAQVKKWYKDNPKFDQVDYMGHTREEYIEKLSYIWGSQSEIYVISQINNVPIVLISNGLNGKVKVDIFGAHFNKPPIFLSYNGSSHYDGIISIGSTKPLEWNEGFQKNLVDLNGFAKVLKPVLTGPIKEEELSPNYMIHYAKNTQQKEATLLLHTVQSHPKKLIDFEKLTGSTLRVLIIVPPRLSLLEQTKQRVQQLEEYFKWVKRPVPLIEVVLGNDSCKTDEKVKLFKDTLEKSDKEFFLIIHDECHWGAAPDSKPSKILHNFMWEHVQTKLLMIQISATAWNQFLYFDSNEILKPNIHPWSERNKDDGEMHYFGRDRLCASKNFVEDASMNVDTLKQIYDLLQVKFSFDKFSVSTAAEVALMTLRYCSAIITHYCAQNQLVLPNSAFFQTCHCPLTNLAVESLFQGNLIACRIPSSPISPTMPRIISSLFYSLGLKKTFCINDAYTDIEDNQLNPYKSANGWIKVTKECADEMARLQNLDHKKPSKNIADQKAQFSQYSDLQGLNCLLIVVEKARMGDTLPPHFTFFDLRARYKTKSFSYAAFLQDLGRAFGWSKSPQNRPRVFMRPHAYSVALDPVKSLQQGLIRSLDPYIRSKKVPETHEDEEDDEEDCKEKEDKEVEQAESLAVYFAPDMVHQQNKNLVEYLSQEKNHHVANCLGNRFILSAEPQIGKTGTYLYFIELLCTLLEVKAEKENEFMKLLHKFKNIKPDELHELLKNDLSKDWKRFHDLQDERFKHGSPETWVPFQRILKLLMSNNPENVKKVAVDMGCGSCQLASLAKSVQWLTVINVDHVRHPDVPKDMEVVTQNFQNLNLSDESADYIIFSLSLTWGHDPLPSLLNAYRICRKGGMIIIFEHENYLPQVKAAIDKMPSKGECQITFNSEATTKRGYGIIRIKKPEKVDDF